VGKIRISGHRRGFFSAWFLLVIGEAAAQHVSVYYYPWYSGANWNQSDFLRGRNRMDIPPLIGTYDNVIDKVSVKQHVEWSTNFGIDTWITSWWGPASYQSNAILKNVMPNLVGTNLTFCLFYETSGFFSGRWTFGDAENQLFYDHVKYMNDNFFSHPNYWKVGGRPVVVVYLSRMMAGNYAAALARVRADFKVFLIGDDFHMGPPDADRHKNWDAITTYNIHGVRLYDGYPQATGYVEAARKTFQNHKKAIAVNGTRFMSNAIPGYNDRAVRLEADNYPIPRRVHADSAEGSTFGQLLDVAVQEGDSLLGSAICSWNEWWEDSQIEPTIIKAPSSKDGTADFAYSKGYQYEGYGADLLKRILARVGRNADVAPALTLLEPASGNSWKRSSQRIISWSHKGIIYYVNLEYHDGTSWARIATQIGNTGSYPWTVPANAALPVNVRVTTVEGVTVGGTGVTALGKGRAGALTEPRIRTFGNGFRFEGLQGVGELAILDLAGRTVRAFSIASASLEWDARDAFGSPLPGGLYRAVFTDGGRTVSRPLLISGL
jgi:hypothetical protein